MPLRSGKIVARPMVVRACVCEQEFQHYEVDRFRAQRLAKFKSTRCSVCAAKLNESQQQASSALPAKGEALQALPPGTQISITRKPHGPWAATLTADGRPVEPAAD